MQALGLAIGLELGQRLGFYLTDALARDAEGLTDLLEGARVAILEAEAQLEHVALAVSEQAEHLDDLLAAHDLVDLLRRRGGVLVLDEVAEQRVAVVADLLMQARGLLADLLDLTHLLRRDAHLDGDLLRSRLAADVLQQLALYAHQLVHVLDHVHGDADGARLVRQRPRDGLADPPRSVSAELEAAPVVELVYGAHEPQVALLDEVEQRHAAPDVALGDGHDEAQVGLDELALGLHVAALDALGQRHLFDGREQRYLAHGREVHAHGVRGGRLDREVELRRWLVCVAALVCGRCGDGFAFDDVDAEIGEHREQLFDLVWCDVDVVQRGQDLGAVQVALFAALLDERMHFVAVEQRKTGCRDVVFRGGSEHVASPALLFSRM